MTQFAVHITTADGERSIIMQGATTPDAASKAIRKEFPGCIVRKVKRDKSSAAITELYGSSDPYSRALMEAAGWGVPK